QAGRGERPGAGPALVALLPRRRHPPAPADLLLPPRTRPLPRALDRLPVPPRRQGHPRERRLGDARPHRRLGDRHPRGRAHRHAGALAGPTGPLPDAGGPRRVGRRGGGRPHFFGEGEPSVPSLRSSASASLLRSYASPRSAMGRPLSTIVPPTTPRLSGTTNELGFEP